jgi:hypothetical protein
MGEDRSMSVRLSGDDARSLDELAADMDVEGGEVLRRALRLLGLVYGLHGSVHGVVQPVPDPREAG